MYPVRKKPPSKQNFKENAPTYLRFTRGKFTMMQMDANTSKLEKEMRDIGDSLHVDSVLLYITIPGGRFFKFLMFCKWFRIALIF